MRLTLAVLATCSALALSACVTPTTVRPDIDSAASAEEAAKQASIVVESRLKDRNRLMNVADRLFVANREFCGVTRKSIGIDLATVHDYEPRLRTAAAKRLGLADAPEVLRVRPDGPAALSGVQEGDELIAVGQTQIAAGARASGDATKALQNALESSAGGPVKLTFRRGAETVTAELQPVEMCGYQVALADSDEVNATADGSSVAITRGLMRFTPKDEELALVVAHELAHNTERHIRAKMTNSVGGMLGGAAVDILFAAAGVNTQGAFMNAGQSAGAAMASPEFEAEADYVGMYFMARAGFDTADVDDFWRRMAVESPKAIFVRSSHPATPERYLAIEKAHGEISAKRAAGAALSPNRVARKEAAAKENSTGDAPKRKRR